MKNLDVKAVSLEELSQRVRHEFYEYCQQIARDNALTPMPSDRAVCVVPYWILDIYSDSLVCAEDGGEYYRVAYTVTADGIQFAPAVEWVSVEKEWVASSYPDAEDEALKHFTAQKPDNFVFMGGEVKALGNGKVGGYLVQYSTDKDPDLTKDFFDNKSDLDIENGERLSVYYDHGKDGTLKNRKIGRATAEYKDAGLWLEAQLEMRDAYEEYVYKMAEDGKLGWSSGPAQHLIRREPVGKSMHITSWPIKEASLTPAPAEFRNSAVALKSLPMFNLEEAVKSLTINTPEQESKPEAQLPEIAQAMVDAVTTDEHGDVVVKSSNIQIVESEIMTDVQTPPVDSLEARFNEQGARLEAALKALENLPISKNPGYITADGGAADPNIKSFGDYLIAVKRGDVKRLSAVYGVKALGDSALSEDQGATGGYLIPQEYIPRLLSVVNQTSGIVPLVNVVNVGSSSGKIPSLDQFFAPTAGVGNSAYAGGVKTAVTAEGGTFTETEPSFEMVEYNINKVGGVIYVTTEMMQDSPISIESLLTQYVGVAIANKEEFFIFRGNGVGQPLGILNSDAAVSTGPDTNNTFAYSDAAEILSRFKSVGGNPTWVAHPSTITDLMRFEVGTGGAVWVANVQGQVPMSLLGYPVRFSEHLPQADNAGHVGLYDLSAYTLFRKGGMSIAYSEHAAFTSGKVAWRFEERLDGKPNLKKAITLADPQGSYTVSPFSLFTD